MRTLLVLLLTVPLGLGADAPKGAAKTDTRAESVVRQGDDLVWKPAGEKLQGVKMAVLAGDPAKDGTFTVRLAFPDGYRVQPHTHPAEEHVTVVSGTFHVARGDTFDAKRGDALQDGDFFTMPANVTHYGWVEGETVIQITATGPWDMTYTGKGT